MSTYTKANYKEKEDVLHIDLNEKKKPFAYVTNYGATEVQHSSDGTILGFTVYKASLALPLLKSKEAPQGVPE